MERPERGRERPRGKGRKIPSGRRTGEPARPAAGERGRNRRSRCQDHPGLPARPTSRWWGAVASSRWLLPALALTACPAAGAVSAGARPGPWLGRSSVSWSSLWPLRQDAHGARRPACPGATSLGAAAQGGPARPVDPGPFQQCWRRRPGAHASHAQRAGPHRGRGLLAAGRRSRSTDHGLGGGGWWGLLPRLFDRFLVVSRFSAATLGGWPGAWVIMPGRWRSSSSPGRPARSGAWPPYPLSAAR